MNRFYYVEDIVNDGLIHYEIWDDVENGYVGVVEDEKYAQLIVDTLNSKIK